MIRLAFALLTILVVPAVSAGLDPLPAHPAHLIVKFGPSIDVCVHCLLERGVPLASVTGSDSLDALNARHGVRAAHAAILEHHGGGRRAKYASRLDAVRARFPVRAARAPAGQIPPDLSGVYVLDLPPGSDVAAIAAEYGADPDVEYAEPDYERRASFVPTDPFFSSSGSWGQSYPDLWGLHMTMAEQAWDVSNGAGTIVAVIDTGVDTNHPDLAANIWTNIGELAGNGIDDDANGFVDDVIGWDFDQGDATPNDQHGHGTHVAGTAAAVGDDAFGVPGMAFGAQIMAVKGLGKDGAGFVHLLAQAMVYAAENGADVLNNSWGGPGISSFEIDAVNTATSLGAVVVAAAGNSGASADGSGPAAIPQVIAVGASRFDDTIASFSSFGSVLSIAAPGVDVLSARGSSSGPVGGSAVGTGHLRLSGTSMASPHAAGLVALLLSAKPWLTPEEVRWHLELNADQVGHPGWEGEAWNPYFGWGRINAANVFDTPPVTTRLRGSGVDLHAFADAILPDAGALDLSFTTLDPVTWTLATPSWLGAAPTNGSGPSAISLTLDTSGLAPGPYSASAIVSAPTAVDGGAMRTATIEVHQDLRIGEELPLDGGLISLDGQDVVSDGLVTMVAYEGYVLGTKPKLLAAPISSDGSLGATSVLVDGFPHRDRPHIASDGRNFLIVWNERDTHTAQGKTSGTYYVRAMRVDSSGAPIDGTPPLVVASRRYSNSVSLGSSQVAFDGESYVVLWQTLKQGSPDKSKVYFQRVGTDGSVHGKPGKLYPQRAVSFRQFVQTRIACNLGQCLVAWHEADGAKDANGHFVDKIYGVRISGEEILDDAAFRIVTDCESILDIAADGNGYFVLCDRVNFCAVGDICGRDAIGARVSGSGVALDTDGIRLNDEPFDGGQRVIPDSVTFDGSSWLVSFRASDPAGRDQVFGARVASDGTLLDDEPRGLLLDDGDVIASTVCAARTHSVLVWREADGTTTRRIRARRLLPHSPWPALPNHVIGTIGAKSVAERNRIAFTVDAPALDPQATTYSASNLPPGATFDPALRAFQWTPEADESGLVVNVTFAADDGVQVASEQVAIAVTEARLSLGGMAALADASPVPGAVIKLIGRGDKREGIAGPDGRFRFDDLAPGVYRIGLARAMKKTHKADVVAVVLLPGQDVKDIELDLIEK